MGKTVLVAYSRIVNLCKIWFMHLCEFFQLALKWSNIFVELWVFKNKYIKLYTAIRRWEHIRRNCYKKVRTHKFNPVQFSHPMVYVNWNCTHAVITTVHCTNSSGICKEEFGRHSHSAVYFSSKIGELPCKALCWLNRFWKGLLHVHYTVVCATQLVHVHTTGTHTCTVSCSQLNIHLILVQY